MNFFLTFQYVGYKHDTEKVCRHEIQTLFGFGGSQTYDANWLY